MSKSATTRTTVTAPATSIILKLNSLCELCMGISFILIPDKMIPMLTSDGITTTRVFGASLIALSCISWPTSTSTSTSTVTTNNPKSNDNSAIHTKRIVICNLMFHILGGLILAIDVATYREESPFIPPTMLHLFLSIALTTILILPPMNEFNNNNTSRTKKRRNNN